MKKRRGAPFVAFYLKSRNSNHGNLSHLCARNFVNAEKSVNYSAYSLKIAFCT